MKQPATSFGIAAAAGIASVKRKLPCGLVSLNVIVLSSGVWMPVIVLAVPLLNASTPSMVE